jgi:NitT/TauT family transport system permease protein
MLKQLFKLRQSVDKKTALLLAIGGVAFILLLWIFLTTPILDNPYYLTSEQVQSEIEAGKIEAEPANNTPKLPLVPRASLPQPWRVFTAFGDLYRDNELIKDMFRSIGLNLGGYIKAILWSLPIGFLIGLVPLFRESFQKVVNSIRFIPLTAVTVLFIVWFGIGSTMKVNFLAFGIMIYLLPVIVQRIDEVNDTYLKTVYTLGATSWQTVKTVYIPSVLSRLSDDIRILTAISWTYIIVAENSGDQGGLGSLIYRAGQRMGRVDKVFAILILIILIGVFQDRIFAHLDRKFFPHKYQTKPKYQKEKILKEVSLLDTVLDFAIDIFMWISLGLYVLFALNEFVGFMGGIKPMSYLFGDNQWAVHMIFLSILGYQLSKLFKPKPAKNPAHVV